MRGTVLFLLRTAIGILIALLAAIFFLLAHNAPSLPNVPFAGIAITAGSQTVHLPNRIFRCDQVAQQVQCNATLQNQTLSLTWQQSGNAPPTLNRCQALFAGKPLQCSDAGMDYIGRKGPLSYYQLEGLGLSQSQLRDLRRQYGWSNALSQIGEARLLQLSIAVALLTGVLVAAINWFYPGRLAEAFVSFAVAAGTFVLVWQWFGSVPYDRLTSFGISPEIWNGLAPSLALLAALLTGIITTRLLEGRFRRRDRIGPILITGSGMFSLTFVSLPGLFQTFAPLNSPSLMNFAPLLAAGIAVGVGVATIGLLWVYSDRSIRTFLCIGSGLGVFGLLSLLFLISLLELGYAD